MSNIRRTTAERLSHAWNTIPHVTQFDKADITAMEELRKKYREQVRQAGGNLTVTAMLVKVIATAVKQFPQFNASLDPQSERDHLQEVRATSASPWTPIADCSCRSSATPIRRTSRRSPSRCTSWPRRRANRKLTLEEMSGGGITISNLGGIGGTYFTPIVNWPEVAILGVSRGIIEPVWRDGHIRATAAAAAVAVLRPPRHRRRRRDALPPLGRRGNRAALPAVLLG